jgi:hypothetical protein
LEVGCQRLFHPFTGDDPLAVPHAIVQIQEADLCQIAAIQVQAAFGVHDFQISALPFMPDSQRREEIPLAVVVDVLTGLFLKDIGEQFRRRRCCSSRPFGFGGHRLVDRVLHPVISGFHQAGIAARVVVRKSIVTSSVTGWPAIRCLVRLELYRRGDAHEMACFTFGVVCQ